MITSVLCQVVEDFFLFFKPFDDKKSYISYKTGDFLLLLIIPDEGCFLEYLARSEDSYPIIVRSLRIIVNPDNLKFIAVLPEDSSTIDYRDLLCPSHTKAEMSNLKTQAILSMENYKKRTLSYYLKDPV